MVGLPTEGVALLNRRENLSCPQYDPLKHLHQLPESIPKRQILLNWACPAASQAQLFAVEAKKWGGRRFWPLSDICCCKFAGCTDVQTIRI